LPRESRDTKICHLPALPVMLIAKHAAKSGKAAEHTDSHFLTMFRVRFSAPAFKLRFAIAA
jgi:hypothetical protein